MKILITGGHITPAVALIEELKTNSSVEIVFVGRQHANLREKNNTFEFQTIHDLGIKFIDLETGRSSKISNGNFISNVILTFKGFVNSTKILYSEKPDIIFSFGGYVALPISVIGSLMRIPVYTHEQTLISGLANRIIGFFSKVIFVSFPESRKYFDEKKVIVVGNLVRKNILHPANKLKFDTNRKIIYITGGSLGAHSINEHIGNILDKLLDKYFVIHQVGNMQEFADFEKFSKIENKNYLPKEHFFEMELSDIYNKADLVISRSGANTVFELMALNKPSILVPLPWSAKGEQQAQANLMRQFGVAEIFDQNESSDKLFFQVEEMFQNLEKYQQGFKKLSNYYKDDAAYKIISATVCENS
jgi:UDP-N-acetylglucosamine--N-acetylmuramyl-(pentapeptide) pyrophosphoryl-undecaprenol N-acetylglucosamine transferase